MPTYGFRCPEGHEFDRFYKIISTAPSEVACLECGKTATRQLHGGAGLVFKGSGFYLTDYGKNAHRGESAKGENAKGESAQGESAKRESAKAESAKGESAKGESSKSETKSESTPAKTDTAASKADGKPKNEAKPKAEGKPARKSDAE